MKLTNDFPLAGYTGYTSGWYVGPGSTQMGADPCFCNVPTWSYFYNNSTYANVTPTAVLPWVAVFSGTGNQATNTAFQFRNLMFYYKSKSTGNWSLLSGPNSVAGMSWGTSGGTVSGATLSQVNVTLSDGSSAIMPPNSNYFWHGWSVAGPVTIDPSDIAAFFVTIQVRLVVADSTMTDDRASAQYGLQVGADYYLTSSWNWGSLSAPSVGISRTKKITSDWQSMSYTTFTDVGVQEPGAGITEAAFRASPPPLQ